MNFWAWRLILTISACGKLKQSCQAFQASLGYSMNYCFKSRKNE